MGAPNHLETDMTLKINAATTSRRLQSISEDFSELLADIKRAAEAFPDGEAPVLRIII